MVRVAAEKGYAATTVTEVAEVAGVSTATFYELFEDKEDCFLESFGVVTEIVLERVGDAYEAASGAPWPERVAAALRALLELLASEADIARLTMVEVGGAGEPAREPYGLMLNRLAAILDEGRDYSPQEDLPPDTARFAVGAATSLIFDEIRAGRGGELEKMLPELVFAVLVPYLGTEAAGEQMRRVAGGG
jgi:AcrR family transcriptional regulator